MEKKCGIVWKEGDYLRFTFFVERLTDTKLLSNGIMDKMEHFAVICLSTTNYIQPM